MSKASDSRTRHSMFKTSRHCFEPGQVRSVFYATVHSAIEMNEYLAVNNGRNLQIKSTYVR